jgi:hypothetical protein
MIVIYDSPDAWKDGKPVRATMASAADAAPSAKITGLPPGTYAAKVFQDVDGDGKMGLNPFGLPTEPYGFSNGAQPNMGPPSFEAAAFEVQAGANVPVDPAEVARRAMNRRDILRGAAVLSGATLLTPEALWAAAANDWALGVADVETDLAPIAMTRLHGRAPPQLTGTLFRNGPARFRRPGGGVGHWFDGDGLVRKFQIADGQARIAARFVDTAKRRRDTAAGAVITPGYGTAAGPGAVISSPDDANAANTSVMMAGGELWALWEGGSPTALDPATLETRGPRCCVRISRACRSWPTRGSSPTAWCGTWAWPVSRPLSGSWAPTAPC